MPPYFVQKEKTPRHTTVGHCANGTKAPCHTTTRLCTKWEPRRNGTAGDILRDVYGSHDAWETDRFSLSPFSRRASNPARFSYVLYDTNVSRTSQDEFDGLMVTSVLREQTTANFTNQTFKNQRP